MAKILQKTDSGLVLERPKMFNDITIGCSIAVSGACLSVIAFDAVSMSFDVVPMTFQKTKLGSLNVGDSVNLERAMKADGRFEGHIVTGHCEGTGIVVVTPKPAPTPDPSPVPGGGSAAVREPHIWKGVSGLTYPPTSVVTNARAMRKEPTEAEEKLWQQLRQRKVGGHHFRRQRPVGSFIIDFYCEELCLGIEVDGGVHDDKHQRAYDAWRSEHLELRGIHMLRFTNDQVMHDISSVIAAIKKYRKVPLHPEGGGVAPERRGGGTVKDSGTILRIKIPHQLFPYIVPHGSITLDGVALTVADLKDDEVTVALIPHTLSYTTLGFLKKGEHVNIETDILGKYILKSHGHQ